MATVVITGRDISMSVPPVKDNETSRPVITVVATYFSLIGLCVIGGDANIGD